MCDCGHDEFVEFRVEALLSTVDEEPRKHFDLVTI
jgi:hypothetical protein